MLCVLYVGSLTYWSRAVMKEVEVSIVFFLSSSSSSSSSSSILAFFLGALSQPLPLRLLPPYPLQPAPDSVKHTWVSLREQLTSPHCHKCAGMSFPGACYSPLLASFHPRLPPLRLPPPPSSSSSSSSSSPPPPALLPPSVE